MKCPHCREKLMQKSGGTTRLRTDGPVTFTGDACRSRCYWCKAEVALPLSLKMPEAPPSPTSHVIRIRRETKR